MNLINESGIFPKDNGFTVNLYAFLLSCTLIINMSLQKVKYRPVILIVLHHNTAS
jgi:hypothetical protein